MRKASVKSWEVGSDVANPSVDAISAGSLQRIADATEKMAENWSRLADDRDYQKRRAEEAERYAAIRNRRISALRGVITRLKNRSKQ